MTTSTQLPITYRRDRFGECWHMVPAGERGTRGRTLCGEPRQGTPLSETYAEVEPGPPECICHRCAEAELSHSSTGSVADVQPIS